MIQLVLSIHTKSNELTFDKHNQLIPDYIVDTFYTQIKRSSQKQKINHLERKFLLLSQKRLMNSLKMLIEIMQKDFL